MQFILSVKNEMGSGISQATGQIKGLGDAADQTQTKAKSSGMGVGQAFQFVALNAFNLASSLIQTKRSYEDLAKAENAQQNKRLAVTTTTNNLKKAEISLAAARQKGDPARIAKAELTLQNAKIRVDKATRAEALGQIELNRAHEDFYLNIIPNVISGIGTIAGLAQVAQNTSISFGSALTKLVIPLAAISAAFFAIKTNFLGFRDFLSNLGRDIGNAVPGLKPLLNVLEAIGGALGLTPKKTNLNTAIKGLMDQFKPLIDLAKGVIDNIMKGNWEGAFKVIQTAATNFWIQLKKNVPLLGDIESLVNKIKVGNWEGAFHDIQVAAVTMWKNLKNQFPILGDIETLVNAIKNGKWDVAFAAIKKAILDSGIQQAIDAAFGQDKVDNFITKFTQIPEIIKANMNAKSKNPFAGTGIIDSIIQLDDWDAAPTVQGIIDALTKGFSQKDDLFGDNPNPPGKKILEDLFASMNNLIKTYVDPFVASLFDIKTWQNALDAINKTKPLTDFATIMFESLFGKKDAKTGKNASLDKQAEEFGTQVITSISNWFRDVMPKSAVATAGVTAFFSAWKTVFDNNVKLQTTLITSIGTNFLNGLKDTFTPEGFAKVVTQIATAFRSAINNAKKLLEDLGNYIWGRIWNAFTSAGSKALAGLGWIGQQLKGLFGFHASGFHGFVNGPTPMVAGERGIEKVDITPMSDIVNQKQMNRGMGTITVIVPVMLDKRQIAEVVASEITVDQAVYR